MPVVVGLLVMPLFVLAVFLLHRFPGPDARDLELRSRRVPMSASKRLEFVWQFLPGVVLVLLVYFFLTAYRDYRDKYGVELFRELGYPSALGLFTQSESIVGLGVLAVLGAINAVGSHARALVIVFVILALGAAMLGGSTALLDRGYINGFQWMVLTGLGAYLAYAPYGAVLFERVVAHSRFAGNAAFAIMLADSMGYTGTVGMLLYKDIGIRDMSRLEFFRYFTYALAAGGIALYPIAGWYFLQRGAAVREQRDARGDLQSSVVASGELVSRG